MSSLDAELSRISTVFSFWMRTNVSAANVPGEYLGKVVLDYYCLPRFEWDSLRKHSDIMLSNKATIITKKDGETVTNDAKSLCSKNVLSADAVSIVCWEITIREKSVDDLCLMMGYIDGEHIDDFVESSCVGDNGKQLALYVKDGRFLKVRTNGIHKDIHPNRPFAIRKGDRFKLIFNFKTKECAARYNDGLLGTLSKNLPRRIYLAASVYAVGDVFETTKFYANY